MEVLSMKRLGMKAVLFALVVALFSGIIAQQTEADNCYECLYELCIPVPLGYGWADCDENYRRCRRVMVVPPMPDQPPIYAMECTDVCWTRQSEPCYELTDPG